MWGFRASGSLYYTDVLDKDQLHVMEAVAFGLVSGCTDAVFPQNPPERS